MEGSDPDFDGNLEESDGCTELDDVEMLEEEVANIRKRSVDVLERILALPDPPRKQHRRRSSAQAKSIKQPEPKIEKPDSPVKSPPITTANLLHEADFDLPDPMERYENRIELLTQELDRLTKYNSRLKARIRDVQMKLREAQVDEEKLTEQFQLSMQQRLFMMPSSLKK